MRPKLIRDSKLNSVTAIYECPVCNEEFTGIKYRIQHGQKSCSQKCGRVLSKAKQVGRPPNAVLGKVYSEFSPVDFKRICKQLNISRANHHDKDLILMWNETTDELLPRLEDKGKELEILGENEVTTMDRLKAIYG
jgi:predicted nucleic acid-binding Zn ribbon protein